MNQKFTISKNNKLPASLDYDLLRKEGLKHIESLCHDLWTDYNSHDPGITILEALCYAITELSYRASFDMKDLMTNQDGSLADNQVFFSPRQILTNRPLTINDYRKLLIDIAGVHNAWLFREDRETDEKGVIHPTNEIPIYADCSEKDTLTTSYVTNQPLYLQGLYRVVLDLDNDDLLGDLNNGTIIRGNPAAAAFSENEFLFSFLLPSAINADFLFIEKAADKSQNHIASIEITNEVKYWNCKLTLDDNSTQEFAITITKLLLGKVLNDADVKNMISADYLQDAFGMYKEKIKKARAIFNAAKKRLMENRNLCEDFVSLTTVEDEEIAFCIDVDVKPSFDIEKIQAEIFYTIENYLNPSVNFYSLKELLDKKIPVDEIFQGPKLIHGFIETEQLKATNLRLKIYTSDIINLLMDIDGIIAVRNFLMTKYDKNGEPVKSFTNIKWCMSVSPLHKPVLSKERSKILLFKDQFPFLAVYSEVKDTIRLLHASRSREKLNGMQDDISRPQGRKRDTESYWPIQYDFPQTYGIGRVGLPSTADEGRIIKQKQLKAYLMFYEQLLADFLAQLSYAPQLFSTGNIMHTYDANFLADIHEIKDIYKPTGAPADLQKAFNNKDSTPELKNPWQQLYEPKYVFEDRRNRFLDHLLARFSESFNDYALMLYSIKYDDKTEEKIETAEITDAKIATLLRYDEISTQRNLAYNYHPQNENFSLDATKLWDTDNVSGLEERICILSGIEKRQTILSGIENYRRRFLYCINNMQVVCEEVTINENGSDVIKCFHRYYATTLNGIRLKWGTNYESKQKADEAIIEIIKIAGDKNNYSFDAESSKLNLRGGSGDVLLETEKTYADEQAALADAEIIAKEFAADCNKPEGLHLVEHILFRPRDADFPNMEVCLHGCDCICELDPYSFRASVVLPYWPEHFDSMFFRSYFENKIREEAPAHVMLKICWLSNELLREFEIAYKAWVEAFAKYTDDKQTFKSALISANMSMFAVLRKLHSEYPQATLHDCEESKEGSNTVVLGKTVLGTFKNSPS